MFKKGTLVAIIFALLFMVTGPASAGLVEKATGDVMVLKNDLWLHWFNFVAQEMGDEPFGTGSITHHRLNDEGTEVLREEQSQIRYVIVEGNEAWFTGPIVYDSNDPNPTRWFVIYVQDNDQLKNSNDLIWFTRVADENEALNLLGSYSWGTYPPDDLESGDITVYSNAEQKSDILDFIPAILAGTLNTDKDNDGYTKIQGDCDDSDPAINPGATEICDNDIDEDCSGIADICPPVGTVGLWHGTLTDGDKNTFTIGGIISTDGQLRFVVDEGLCIGTQYAGTLTLNGDTGSGSFTGFATGECLFENGTQMTSGTFDLTASGDNVTGTYTAGGDSGTFTLTNNHEAEESVTLADLQGTWIAEEGDFTEITISADGSFTGADIPYGCNVSGQISIINPDWSITSVSVTKSDCDAAHRNDTYTGLGVLVFQEESQSNLFAILVSSSAMSNFGFFTPAP